MDIYSSSMFLWYRISQVQHKDWRDWRGLPFSHVSGIHVKHCSWPKGGMSHREVGLHHPLSSSNCGVVFKAEDPSLEYSPWCWGLPPWIRPGSLHMPGKDTHKVLEETNESSKWWCWLMSLARAATAMEMGWCWWSFTCHYSYLPSKQNWNLYMSHQ